MRISTSQSDLDTPHPKTREHLVKVIGRETIHPVVFYTGKVAGYTTWVLLALSICDVFDIGHTKVYALRYTSYCMLLIEMLITTISLINLGSSTRLGLPKEATTFKKNGLYKLSRNPMYVGFDLITVASILYHLTLPVIILGLYSLTTYHMIIVGEERFLATHFGQDYINYKAKVRRYL